MFRQYAASAPLPIALLRGLEQLALQHMTPAGVIDERLLPPLSDRQTVRIVQRAQKAQRHYNRRRAAQDTSQMSKQMDTRIGTLTHGVLISHAPVLSIVGAVHWAESLARAQLVHAACTLGTNGWRWSGDVPEAIRRIADRGEERQPIVDDLHAADQPYADHLDPASRQLAQSSWQVSVRDAFTLRVSAVSHEPPIDIPILQATAAAIAISNDRCMYRQGSDQQLQIKQPDLLSAVQFQALSPLWTA